MARYGPVWAQPTDSYPVQTGLTATGRWLREHCENARAKLLILDPLVNAFGASENAIEDAARFVADWGDWAHLLRLYRHPLPSPGQGRPWLPRRLGMECRSPFPLATEQGRRTE